MEIVLNRKDQLVSRGFSINWSSDDCDVISLSKASLGPLINETYYIQESASTISIMLKSSIMIDGRAVENEILLHQDMTWIDGRSTSLPELNIDPNYQKTRHGISTVIKLSELVKICVGKHYDKIPSITKSKLIETCNSSGILEKRVMSPSCLRAVSITAKGNICYKCVHHVIHYKTSHKATSRDENEVSSEMSSEKFAELIRKCIPNSKESTVELFVSQFVNNG